MHPSSLHIRLHRLRKLHAAATKPRRTGMPQHPSRWYGVLLAALVATVAMGLGNWLPTVGGPVFAILLGLLIRNTVGVMPLYQPGLNFASKVVLQWSIILLGFGLSFGQVVRAGIDSLWVTVLTIAAAFVTAYLLGRWLRVEHKLRHLIGVGTAICGGSAIAAVAPIIKPQEHEMALAIATIFLFNVAAVLVFPFFGHLFNMTDIGFGLWAGTAINDTSSVVAAAYSYSDEAGNYATIVKLTRATFIIPICVIYVLLAVYHHQQVGHSVRIRRLIPWFIIWFVGASLVRSAEIVPVEVLSILAQAAKFFMVVALAAIGLSSNMRMMARAGWQPLALGLGTWCAVAVTSLVVQNISGAW